MAPRLCFNSQGSFKIAQFTDLHWGDGNENDKKTTALIELVLAEEKPDLAVLTGDLIESVTCTDPQLSIRHAVAPLEEAGVPWAAVFGNHDAEGNVTREQLMDSLSGSQQGLMSSGPADINGVGNYVLRIAARDGRTDQALFFIDSGDYADPRIGGYGAIARNQIEWFVRESDHLAANNRGVPVPALAFFHIPLPEYNEAWDFQMCRGSKYEEVCCPRLNTGMFAAMVQAGNVAGTFVGHDHANDFCGELQGISLCYGRKTGYNNYMPDGFRQGTRLIVLKEGSRGFQTWLRLDNGDTVREPSVHLPEGRKPPHMESR